MSTEEQQRSGSVPHAYGNALAWRWTRDMPATVRRSGLPTLLYALRSMANAAGELRFTGDRKAIRVSDIAKAACVDENDARRYLTAAEAAGVVTGGKGRKRGRATVYALVLNPSPDWTAAAASLEQTKRKRPERKPPPWRDEKFRGGPPELPDDKFGGPPPELTAGTPDEVPGTAPVSSSGDRPRNGSGDRPRNNPGIAKELPHEAAEVVGQPHVDGGPGTPNDHSHEDTEPAEPDYATPEPPLDFARCAACGERMVPRPGRTTHTHCQPAEHRRAS
ncbi:hypothetical protein ABZ820_34815 [Streptomyces diacarni]|uniref:hypothetical protein n=1 Tax=Streptomyces diacarni TaxID=2800381 RepID=UPI0033C8B910